MGRDCESLLELLSSRGVAGPELAAHLAGCADCRAAQSTLKQLRARGSVVTPAALVPLKAKVMARFATAAAAGTSATAATTAAGAGTATWLMVLPIVAAVAGTLYLSRPAMPTTAPATLPATAVSSSGTGSVAGPATPANLQTGSDARPVEMSSERTGTRVTAPPARASETRVLPNDDDAPTPTGPRTNRSGPP